MYQALTLYHLNPACLRNCSFDQDNPLTSPSRSKYEAQYEHPLTCAQCHRLGALDPRVCSFPSLLLRLAYPASVYSAYEFSLIPVSTPPAPRTGSLDPHITLPLDIVLETLASVLVLCVGIVMAAPDLKPIQWRVWAGQIEKEKLGELKNLDDGPGGNPYFGLEKRSGFLDIRALREETTAWAKEAR